MQRSRKPQSQGFWGNIRVTQSISSTPDQERLVSIDVLRGFALLGILTMNIGAFSMPDATYFAPVVYGDLSGLNGLVWGLTHVFADMKFMAIFSMLFGAGIVLMSDRMQARGASPAGVHYRRVLWLALFGLLHAHLLWYGDILYWYGVCGLFVYLLRKLSPTWLIAWGLLILVIGSSIMLSVGMSEPNWPAEMRESINADLRPSAETIAREIEIYRGGWLEQMQARVPKSLELQTGTLVFWAFWRISGLMLLGMGLYKLGVFSAQRSKAVYGTLVALAVVVGVPVIVYGIRYQFSIDWRSPQFFFIGTQFNYWASIPVSLGWTGLVMLLCLSGRLPYFTERLAAVGRTAFTNYILQTLICTTIFYGHGLGYFGQFERTTQFAIVVAVWILQLAISPLWLQHFRFGPLEWLWRSLTYWRWQPFRRAAEG